MLQARFCQKVAMTQLSISPSRIRHMVWPAVCCCYSP